MTTTDNVRRLDDAMAERGQPIPISKAALYEEATARRSEVLDRLAVVRMAKQKNISQIVNLEAANADLDDEQRELEMLADAMLSEIHAFDRIGQGRV